MVFSHYSKFISQYFHIKQLTKWNGEGHDVNQILNTSMMNGWKGVFKPKQESTKHETRNDRIDRLTREAIAD